MHVPKSAGSSVHSALEQALPAGTISPKRHDTSLLGGGFREYHLLGPHIQAILVSRDDEIASLSNYSVISGHFSLSTLLRVTSASSVATVLREPRARVLSHYAFWRLYPPTDRHAWRAYPGLDHALRPLDEFLREPLIATQTDNVVCRMLLGEHPRIPRSGFIADSDIDAVALDAIGALETLGYVGVLELGDSMWEGLSRFFGAPLAPTCVNTTESHIEIANAPAARDIVTVDTLALLDSRTAADAIVWRHVLLTSGYATEYVERLQATVLAAELVRIGNLVGTSATEARIRGRKSEELARQLHAKDEELARQAVGTDEEVQRVAALVHETRRELAERTEELRWHRFWLQGIQGSVSWRLTAPLRAGKRTFIRLPRPVVRMARRADTEP